MRRFIPITVPGLLLAATIVVAELWRRRQRFLRYGSVAVAAVSLAFPLSTMRGELMTTVEHQGRYPQALALCIGVGDNPVVVRGANTLSLTVRVVCGNQVLTAGDSYTERELILTSQHLGHPIAVVSTIPGSVDFTWTEELSSPTIMIETAVWDQSLTTRVSRVRSWEDGQWIGITSANGKLVPVPTILRVEAK
jgi:hypothetical protein